MYTKKKKKEKKINRVCRYKDELNTFSVLKIRVKLRQMSKTAMSVHREGGRKRHEGPKGPKNQTGELKFFLEKVTYRMFLENE